ncbi:MAG: CHAT domain-containing protein [Anaerolineae bacterium]
MRFFRVRKRADDSPYEYPEYDYRADSAYNYNDWYGHPLDEFSSRQPRWLRGILVTVLIAILLFVAYRAYATRWPRAPGVLAPEVVPVKVAHAGIGEPDLSRTVRYTARYTKQGKLLDVRDQTGAIVPNLSQLDIPPALDKTLQGSSLGNVSEALAGISVLQGAVYDPDHLQLVLIGELGPSTFGADDLRVALKSVSVGEDPGVSIDPGSILGEMVVRYIGPTKGTHFGWIMFESDRRMKTLGLGYDSLTKAPVSGSVPGYQSHLDLVIQYEADEPPNSRPIWHRFWFVPDSMKVGLSSDGHAMRFLDSNLRVDRECLDEKLNPLPNCKAPAAQAFANHLTEHYDQYAADFPILRQLEELAKLVSLAKWLQDEDISTDLAWLGVDEVEHTDTPVTTPGITVTQQITETQITPTGLLTNIQTFSLYGGVKFHFDNEYVSLAPSEPTLDDTALRARPSAEVTAWNFTYAGETQKAVAFSLEEEVRIGLLPTQATTDLALGAVGESTVGIVRFPAPVQEAFGLGWRLDLSQLTFPEGEEWYAPTSSAKPELVPPRLLWKQHRIAEQKPFEFWGWDNNGRRVFDRTDGLAIERVLWTSDQGYVLETIEGYRQQFDHSGHLLQLMDASGHWARYAYEGGQLSRIEHWNGASLTLYYKGGYIEEVVSSTGERRRYVYDAWGRLIRVIDENGNILVEYEYDAENHIVAVWDGKRQLQRRNVYDETGRLISFQQEGVEFTFKFADDGYEISYEVSSVEPAPPVDMVEVKAILERLPEDQQRVEIQEALESLDGAQLLDLKRMIDQSAGELFMELVDDQDIDFIAGEARKMIPGISSFAPWLYQVGDHWLMAYVNDTQTTPGRPDMIDRLLSYHRLQRRTPEVVALLFRSTNTSLQVLVGGQVVEITLGELETIGDRMLRMFSFLPFVTNNVPTTVEQLALRHPGRVGRILMGRGVIPKDKPIIGFDGDLLALNLQQALPKHRIWRTYGTEVEKILSRLEFQRQLFTQLEDIVFLNGAPIDDDGLRAIKKEGESAAEWREIHTLWKLVAEAYKVEERVASEEALIEALQTKPQVVVLVAHSDGLTIYFPDRTYFDAKRLSDEVVAKIRDNGPIVCLFSCKTGSINNQEGLAKALIEAGAQGVIAPAGDIGARTSSDVLRRFLEGVAKGQSFLESLWNAIRASDLQNWIGRRPLQRSAAWG